MNIELQNYLYKTFPKIFPTEPKIQCENGWFYLILWTCRFLVLYKEEFDKLNQKNPLIQPEILQIKNKNGLLNIILNNEDEKIKSFINTIYFISGYICEKSGRNFNNLIDIENEKIINEEFINQDSSYQYLDNKELRSLISKVFNL